MANSLIGCRVSDLIDRMEHSYVDVGSTSLVLAMGHPERRFLLIQNDGGDDVYLMFGKPAVLHQGMCLKSGANAVFAQCSSSLCPNDIYGITRPNKVCRILVTEGF